MYDALALDYLRITEARLREATERRSALGRAASAERSQPGRSLALTAALRRTLTPARTSSATPACADC